MRGNHRIWFRNDYTPPEALTLEQLERVRSVTTTPKDGTRTWHEVWTGATLMGFVTKRMGGLSYRRLDHEGWTYAAKDQRDDEPPHGRAILALLDDVETNCSSALKTVS